MTDNKERFKQFLKVIGLFAWAFIAIGASVAAIESLIVYYIVCGVANLAINGICIYKTSKEINV